MPGSLPTNELIDAVNALVAAITLRQTSGLTQGEIDALDHAIAKLSFVIWGA